MKNTTSLIVAMGLVLSLVIAVSLGGCSSRSSSYYSASSSTAMSSMPADMAPAPAEVVGESGSGFANMMLTPKSEGRDLAATTNTDAAAPAPTNEPRKLVKDSSLYLESKEFDTALSKVVSLVTELGGYVDSQSVDGISIRDSRDYYERTASVTARIPADKLDSFTSQLGTLCNIVSHSESVSDITDSYYDAQSRLDTLSVKEARLIELLAKAEKLEDIISLEDALGNCQYEMDSLTGQLRRMDNRVSYSTCNIQLSEVVEYSDVQLTPRTFGERLTDSLRYSWRNLSNSVQNTIIGLVENGPVTIFYLAIWGAIFYLAYRVFFRKKFAFNKQARKVTPTEVETPVDVTPDDKQ